MDFEDIILTDASDSDASSPAMTPSIISSSAASTTNHIYLGPPFDLPIEGIPDTLQCEQCHCALAEVRCQNCGQGAFCSYMCYWQANHSAPGRGHVCGPTYETNADGLCESLVLEQPFDDWTWRQFFCERPKAQMEKLRPLFLYVHKDLMVSRYEFDNWRRANCVYRNLVRIINRNLDSVPVNVLRVAEWMSIVYEQRENTHERINMELYHQLDALGQTGREARVQRR